MFWITRIGSAILAIAACFLIDAACRHSLDDYKQSLVMLAALYVTLSVSLNLINGITGQFSIGHAAFYLIGAYSAGVVSRRWITVLGHSPPQGLWIVGMMLFGALMAGIAGFVVGLPSLRLKGDYLAIVTLGFGEIVRIVVLNTDALGGAYALQGIPQIHPIWLFVLLAITCIAVSRNLIKTARGLTFLAVREDEIASQAMGVNVTKVKVTAFVLGSAFAGAAGTLLAHFEGAGGITPDMFKMDVSFTILTMVILGGTGSITGSVFSALFLFYLPEYLRGMKTATGAPLAVSGATVVASLLMVLIAVVCVKKILDSHWGDPKKRGGVYVAIVAASLVLVRLLVPLVAFIKPLNAMLIPTEQLRMVIFAVTLIVVMLLRPQGIFAHHEFSWTWVQKLFGAGTGPKSEVAA